MASKKKIAVIGATGSQGGGLVNAILKGAGTEFEVRAITRNAGGEKAKAYAAQGAEVVEANIDDEDSVVAAFEGCHGAFCITFFWDHFSVLQEQHQARLMARAAKKAGIKHVIWSTLEDSREYIPLSDDRMPTLQGKYKVPHYDSKGSIDHVFTDEGLPVTFLRTSFYWDNLYAFGMGPTPGVGDEYELTFPMGDARIPGIAAEDIGKCALGIFQRGDEFIGKTVGIVGENLTGAEMAEKLSSGLGINVRYCAVTPERYRGFGFPGADDIGNMFQFWHDFEDEYVGNRDRELSKELSGGKLMDFDAWLAKYGHKINYRVTGPDLKKWADDHGMRGKQYYVYFSTPNEGVTRVMQDVEPHLQHLYRLEREGLLVFSGPFADANSDSDFIGDGMVVLRCANIEEARAIAEADPFHVSGVRSYTVKPWQMNEGVIRLEVTNSTMKSDVL